MVRPKKRFQQLIAEIDATPWGPQEQALVAEAVALAQEIGDEQLEYQARMRQTASANISGSSETMLSSFAWCLAQHDKDPRRFPNDLGNGGADLMWQFKWMAATLQASPAFSQEQISAVLDDMEAHYRRGGLGMSGVLTARFEDAWMAGRLEEADRLRIQVETTPRDEHSHCDACVRSQSAGFFAETDRDPEAIRLVEEMIEGGFQCAEEPAHALSRALLPYLRSGRPEDAKVAHLRSYRESKDNPDNLAIVANNVVFCAITGNEARALTMVERHLPWLAHDRLNVAAHFTALASFALALDRVTAVGHGDTPVRGAEALTHYLGEHEGPWAASALAAAAWRAVDRIGAEFDRRDETSGHARKAARIRALTEERYDVPIRSDAFIAAPAPTEPADADGWFDRAVALAGYGAEQETLNAIAKATVADPERRARLLSHRIGTLFSLDRAEEAAAALPERVAALREAGDEVQAALEERLGLARYGRATDEDFAALEREWADAATLPARTRADLALTLALARMRAEENDGVEDLLVQTEEVFAETGDERSRTRAALTRTVLRLRTDDGPAASALLDEILVRPALDEGQRARALELRARLRGGAGEFAAGAADADEASRILGLLGGRQAFANAQMLAGALWEDAGEPEQALTRYRVGARLIEREGDDREGAEFRLARAMLATGAAAEAVEILEGVVQREHEAEAAPESLAASVELLARAFAAWGEFGQAFGAFGYTAELYERAEAPVDRAMAMVEQAKILARFEEHADAVSLLEQAEELVRPAGVAGALAEVLHQLGQIYGAQRDERAFGLFDEVQRIAAENEAAWLIADVTDSQGRAHAQFGRTEEAVAAALSAADGFAALGDEGAAGGSELFAARVLLDSGREADAVPLYRGVIERAAGIPPLRQVAALELGDVLDRLGRTGEAAEVRALAEE